MLKFVKAALIISVLFTTFYSSVLAQDEKKEPELFLIHEDIVKPSMVEQYETTVKKLFEIVNEHKLDIPSIHTSMTRDFQYFYITPLENYASMDANQAAWGKLIDKIGQAKWDEIDAGFKDCYVSHRSYTIKRLNDISYQPEDARLKMEDIGFLNWDFYLFEEGYDKEVNDLAKKYLANRKAKGIKDAFNIYISDIGTEMSMYIVVDYGKDAADYEAQNKKNRKLIGDLNKKLNKKMLSMLKSYKNSTGKIRSDLSYVRDK